MARLKFKKDHLGAVLESLLIKQSSSADIFSRASDMLIRGLAYKLPVVKIQTSNRSSKFHRFFFLLAPAALYLKFEGIMRGGGGGGSRARPDFRFRKFNALHGALSLKYLEFFCQSIFVI